METPSPPPERPDSQTTDDVDNLSLQQRARRYPRSRIIVEPLLWTKLQLDLLQCTFAGPYPAPPVIMELDNPSNERVSRAFAAAFKGLVTRHRSDAMRYIFCAYDGLLKSVNDVYFYFGARHPLLPCLAFVVRSEIEPGPVPIVAAHIDFRQLAELRARKIYNQCTGRRRHLPGLALGKLILKKFRTDEPLHEPYIVALLIAVAQSQWWFIVKSGLESRASGVKPRVLFTTDDKESIYLYSAKVSSAFIYMLNNPQTPPTTPQPLHIQITKIPCKPHDTLRNRLYALILSATTPRDVSISADVVIYK
ncbi:hypothetical protein G6O67_004251 [Ophiocordyceps sinensis]|uniref:Uncharacterized protein n=1 Tax=Ophiocordyceps sinensis TaxID=72228 RepID=A0A8H4PNI7_9HYPO|nr:hypothetical protein G6O67_004251 [Ophiocordyceps sinensis]